MPATPITLTNVELLKVYEGLRALDGERGESGVVTPYDFDVGLVWNIAKNRVIVERGVEAFNRAKTVIAAQHGVVDQMKLTVQNAAAIAAYQAAEADLLQKSDEYAGLLRLKRADLQKAGVKTPGTYARLMPLLSDQ